MESDYFFYPLSFSVVSFVLMLGKIDKTLREIVAVYFDAY